MSSFTSSKSKASSLVSMAALAALSITATLGIKKANAQPANVPTPSVRDAGEIPCFLYTNIMNGALRSNDSKMSLADRTIRDTSAWIENYLSAKAAVTNPSADTPAAKKDPFSKADMPAIERVKAILKLHEHIDSACEKDPDQPLRQAVDTAYAQLIQ